MDGLLRTSIAPLVALAICMAAVGSANAQTPRTIVLRFEGPRASAARDAVIDALAPEVQLVTEAQAISTAAQIDVDVSSPEGMATVVEHLRIELVVVGSVTGRGRDAQTTLIVIDPSGDELAQRTAPAPRRVSDREAIALAAVEAIREAQATLAARRQPEPAPEPTPEPRMFRAPEPETEVAAGWRQPQLVVYGGVRVRNAGTYVTDTSARVHQFTADAYPEIDLELLYRPWFDARDALRGLYFGIQGSFSVGISYLTATQQERGMTSLRFRLDIGYGHVFGDIFELAGVVGFGMDGVQLDMPDVFPSTLFSYLRPGIVGRLRAIPDFLILEAGVGGRIGVDGGPVAAAYGPSLFFGGVDVFFGVAGMVAPGFSWAARIGYAHHALSLSEGGGTSAVGVSGTDEALEGRFLIGWTI